jgi:hypothetical protein
MTNAGRWPHRIPGTRGGKPRGVLFLPARTNPAGSCRGLYQADRQPSVWQYTTTCPAGPRPLAASAGAQPQSAHDTMIRPGPQGCPFRHAKG